MPLQGLFRTIFVLNLMTFAPAAAGDDSTFQNEIHKTYARLKNLTFDPSRVARINDLEIKRDRGTFILKSGALYFSEEVMGQSSSVVFLGDGVFRLTPPNNIERSQVRRFLDKDSLDENFSAAVFRFSGDFGKRLVERVKLSHAKIPAQVIKLNDRAADFMLDDRGINLASQILVDLMNENHSGFLIAIMEHKSPNLNLPNYFIFSHYPGGQEGIRVHHFFPNRARKPLYTLCSFADSAATENKPDTSSSAMHISHYNLDVDLTEKSKVSVTAELTLHTKYERLKAFPLSIFPEIEIDSISCSSADSITFIKEKKEASFSVFLNDGLTAGHAQKIVISYSGKLMTSVGSDLKLKSNVYWYPRYGYLAPATYTLNFTHDIDTDLVCVGNLTGQSKQNKAMLSKWEINFPVISAVFAAGTYDSTSVSPPESPPIYIFSDKSRSRSLRETVIGDVASSLFFFSSVLGKYPYKYMNIVETPGVVSSGFPGVLLLSSVSFGEQQIPGIMEALRGHEVSHMWWGNQVGWKTYHDQWLSEGFAEYFGAIAVQFLLNDKNAFVRILEGWGNDLLNRGHIGVSIGLRRFGFSKNDLRNSEGLEAGPIWLGRRLGQKFPVDYYLIVYEKGAYVMHMLRMLFRDFATGSDDAFWKLLADFVETFAEKKASTRDFINIASQHYGENLNWFFQQWVYGTTVPTYTYSVEIIEQENRYWVDLSVSQQDVAAGFKMPVPVKVTFAGHDAIVERVFIGEPENAFRLGPYAFPPQKIEFNAFASVLARTHRK